MLRIERIETMTDDQCELCAEVIRQSFATVAQELGLTRENCPTNGAFLHRDRLLSERQQGFLQFTASVGEQIIGFFELAPRDDGVFSLEKLAVLPNFRHSGYGSAMLSLAAAWVKDTGGKQIHIGIIEENARLKNWYAQHGFVHLGTKLFAHLPFTVGYMALDVADQDA